MCRRNIAPWLVCDFAVTFHVFAGCAERVRRTEKAIVALVEIGANAAIFVGKDKDSDLKYIADEYAVICVDD